MPKLKSCLLLVLAFSTAKVFAQDVGKFYQALAAESSHTIIYDSSFVETYIQRDSLMINDIKNPNEMGLFIKMGGKNKIYAVEINNYLRPDLTAIFKLLLQCPNLQYLKIIDRYGSGNAAEYKLPNELTELQQLKGIEFSFIDKLDMTDALFKVSTLKNLQMLVFTDYRWKLPPILSSITQITSVRLSTLNISGLDLSNTNWQSAHVREVPLDPDNNGRAMLELSKVRSLRNLNLEYVKLRDTAVIGKFTQLTNLEVSGWNFKATELLNKIGRLTQLRRLSLELPLDSTYAFGGLKPLNNLTYFAIYTPLRNDKRIDKVMDVITGFKNLESLTIRGYFTTMPDVFDKLQKLKTLSLTYNALTTLPIGIFKLPNLEQLDVSSNNLTELPYSDKYESNSLKTLNLKDNYLTNLPPAITKLNLLENINVDGNKLTDLPDGWQNLTRLKQANFNDNMLTKYPPGLQDNHSVENVSLFLNKISSIPNISEGNYLLRSLALSNNQLTTLPEHIGRYNNLVALDASNNKITSLPVSLGDCKQMQHLELRNSLGGNVKLPVGLKDATDLNLIDLSYNSQLNNSTIFDIILSVPRTRLSVDLHNCGFDRLPATKQWAIIPFWSLNLSSNKLGTLPVEFADVKVYRGVELGDNPFPGNPRIYYVQAKTKADMAVIFKEINTRLPDATAPKADRVNALLAFSHNFYYQGRYTEALQYAKQAMAIDITLYKKTAKFDEIGICRFNLKDYSGALKDFERFVSRPNPKYTGSQSEAWGDKIKAHIILNQLDEAAKAKVKYFGGIDNCQSALMLCKQSGNKILYNQLLDSTLAAFKRQLDLETQLAILYRKAEVERNGYKYGVSFIFNYACLLIMANRPADAIEIMKKNVIDPFPQLHYGVRALLTAFADYLSEPAAFDKIKIVLQTKIDTDKKISPDIYHINLGDFDQWLPFSNFSKQQQEHLSALKNIVK